MSETNEAELIDDEILHQLEESLGKETIEKQLHRRDSQNPKGLSPQVSISTFDSCDDCSVKLHHFTCTELLFLIEENGQALWNSYDMNLLVNLTIRCLSSKSLEERAVS